LAALPARNGDLIRPLIRARKNDVLAHVERHRIPFVEDPSNRDQRFLRVRVRTELMPVLTRLSPRIVEHLNALADDLVPARDAVTALERELALGSSLLGTAQRTALRQMIERRSRSARVRLKDGKELHWDAASGSVVVGRAPGRPREA
jgi:tRNA(Ile)-lysidine synthase